MLETMRSMIDTFEDVYLVIDALDECENREALLNVLDTINSWNSKPLHILFMSRKEIEIENAIRPVLTAHVEIEPACIQPEYCYICARS